MDALALHITKARCKLLDGRYLHISKPDFIVRKRTSSHSAAEHFIDTITAQIAVAVGVLSGKTVKHIEVGTTDERDHVTMRLFILLSIFIGPGPR